MSKSKRTSSSGDLGKKVTLTIGGAPIKAMHVNTESIAPSDSSEGWPDIEANWGFSLSHDEITTSNPPHNDN